MSAPEEALWSKFNSNEPVTAAALMQFNARAAFELPGEYVHFLTRSNGGEGFVNRAYVILWRVEELLDFNVGYEVSLNAPGLFLFGSDGGGEAFAFDRRRPEMSIVRVPFVGMALDVAEPVGDNFDAFLLELSRV